MWERSKNKVNKMTAPVFCENMNIYVAAPFGSIGSEKRCAVEEVRKILQSKISYGDKIFCPWDYKIPNAWDYPNTEWAQMVFANDVKAINSADIVVAVSYGRAETTSGTNWEIGYAFGIGKKVIVVEMTDNVMSLMISNGCYAVVRGLIGLRDYDFDKMPKLRTETEQK